MGALTKEQRDGFDEQGFVRLPGFADVATCEAMLADVIAVTRAQAAGTPEPEALGPRRAARPRSVARRAPLVSGS